MKEPCCPLCDHPAMLLVAEIDKNGDEKPDSEAHLCIFCQIYWMADNALAAQTSSLIVQ